MTTATTRTEHDLLGDRDIPAGAYYGVHTLWAVENFPVTGTPISHYPDLIRALAQIKRAAARANQELGRLNRTRADAIVAACRERLVDAIGCLRAAFQRKADAFGDVLKMGHTQGQSTRSGRA